MNPRITAEEFQPLGPPIRTPTPAPEPVRRPDGIVVHPDGRMSTDLPLPDGMGTPVWPFPTTPTPTPTPAPVEDAQCLKPAPLKIGDKVRMLVDYCGVAKAGDIFAVDSLCGHNFWAGRACLGYAGEGETWVRA